MGVLEDLGKLPSAEEFFQYLDVSFDPVVVQVVRLHILRRMGQYIKGSEVDGVFEGLADPEIKAMCKTHLENAYQDFLESTPMQERLFKVLKEAVQPKVEPKKVGLTTLGVTTKAK
jgi:nitrogenase-stabilizing/protective protein